MKKKKLIYIAGPLTSSGYTELNVRDAVLTADKLSRYTNSLQGFVPHLSIFWNMILPNRKTYEYWLNYDFNIILKCDALLRIGGESKGADKEVEFAKKNNIPVYFDILDLINKEVRKQGDLYG
jgi:nucleoside 2-deoxyribosyltransferase